MLILRRHMKVYEIYPHHHGMGVYIAYRYYKALLKRIKQLSAERVMRERIRIPDARKIPLMIHCYIEHQLNLI
jgi:hypothetical protein